jgi:ABC-type nickel/cobalt efflux system permease component RcnA
MIRRLLPLAGGALLAAATCGAHPLGSFSVNRLSEVRLDSSAVRVTYTADFAEIPTFQELRALDADDDGAVTAGERERFARRIAPQIARNIRFTTNGRARALRVTGARLTQVDGEGGLPCTRIVVTLACPGPSGSIDCTYRDENYSDRIGWADVVVRAGKGVSLVRSDAPDTDVTRGLTTYPEDVLASPAARTSATFTARVTRAAVQARPAPRIAAAPPALEPHEQHPAPTERRTTVPSDRFTALIAQKALSFPVLLTSLLVALTLGAVHALSPGHGKTVVGAYLVGSRGTAKHALFLGFVVTLTHTIGVYALGVITLLASRYVLPERLFPWLGFASGVMVAVIGGMLFHERIERLLGRTRPHRHLFFAHAHDGGGDQDHLPADAAGAITWRSLLALGVSGGIVPCPSAIVVLLSAIALHRVGCGRRLIFAFSIGLAAVLVALGLVAVYGARYLQRFSGQSWAMRALPVGSAMVVTVLGLVIAVQALVTGGVLRLSL